MSIYKKVLGNQFKELHPKLRYRYLSMGKKSFHGIGMMKTIHGGPIWLYPLWLCGVKWKLLFPEKGENIPFTIQNTPQISANGEEQIHWERKFIFGKKVRYFNALMSLDSNRNIITDYLGEPSRVYSDLKFNIGENGELLISSLKQRLIFGKVEIPLPKLFQGIATVMEGYCVLEEVYTIEVEVRNPIIGRIFSYRGVFKEDDISSCTNH